MNLHLAAEVSRGFLLCGTSGRPRTLIGTVRLPFQRTLSQLLPLPPDKGRLGLSLRQSAHPVLWREGEESQVSGLCSGRGLLLWDAPDTGSNIQEDKSAISGPEVRIRSLLNSE